MPKKIDTSFENFARVASDLKLDLYEVSLLLKFVAFAESKNKKREDDYQKYKEYISGKVSDPAIQVLDNLMENSVEADDTVKEITKILVKWNKETKKR